MTDYKRLRSLFFEINEILDNAPEEESDITNI